MTPIGCLTGLQLVLSRWAAHEVREDSQYDILFLCGGAAWLGLVGWSLCFVGLVARDDAVETSNTAGVAVLCGAWIGATLCYAGANIGEGPTIWTTFGSAALATGALLALWFILELITHVSEAVVVDRDVASGVRVAGFLIAAGLVLGRAVAGDWVSSQQTLHDFLVLGWPAVLLLLPAIVFQYLWRPTPRQPTHPVLALGLTPATGLFVVALLYLLLLGAQDLHPK